MIPLKKATSADMKTIQDGFKLYKPVGKFTYVRKDYIQRCIDAGEVFLDCGVIAFMHRMTRRGRVGTYQYSSGEWHIHQFLSLNLEDSLAPFKFHKRFAKEYVQPGRMFGCIWNSNKQSLDYHAAFGFKKVGDISWANGSIPGIVVAYDIPKIIEAEKFIK